MRTPGATYDTIGLSHARHRPPDRDLLDLDSVDGGYRILVAE